MNVEVPLSQEVIQSAQTQAKAAFDAKVSNAKEASSYHGIVSEDVTNKIEEAKKTREKIEERFKHCSTTEALIETCEQAYRLLPSDPKYKNKLEATLPRLYLEAFMKGLAEVNSEIQAVWEQRQQLGKAR